MHWPTLTGRRSWPFLLLFFILAVALALRLYDVNWDSGYGFHPDERDIYMRSGCMYDLLTEAPNHQNCGYVRDQPEAEPGLPSLGVALDADRSPLNPHWFPLGSILIYVMVGLRFVVERFTDIGALDMRYVGRPLSALADVGSVFMLFLLGRRMYGMGVGLLAAALTAVAVIHIQNSHFYRPETFSAFFTLASLWAMLRMVERKRLRDSALLGLLLGLALAPKVNVLPLVIPMALAYGYRVLDSVEGRWGEISPQVVQCVLIHALLTAGITVTVFFVTAPYALLDFGEFVGDLATQANMAQNAGLWPFTVQYIDTPAFLYQFQQTAIWGLGMPLGALAWAAIPFTVVLALKWPETRRADLLLLAWVVPGLLILESFEVRFQRYLFPLMPLMILMAARMLMWLVHLGRSATPSPALEGGGGALRGLHAFLERSPTSHLLMKWLPVGLVVVVTGSAAFYALAFQRVYAGDHPAIAASEWINEQVPKGTAIVSDNHWDEFIPELYQYSVWQFPVYDPDSPQKMSTLAGHLAGAEYLVFYSNRPYGSVARVPERYPLSASYYRQLFGGMLGYRLERSFTSFPELLGVSFQDDPFGRAGLPSPLPIVPEETAFLTLNLGYADDNVVGYDHPRVMMFRNVEHIPEDILRIILAGPNADAPAPPLGLMLSEQDKEAQRAGGTWSSIINRSSWTNAVPVLAWLLVVELIYLAALPLTMLVFRPLPDRGIVLARVLGLLLVSYVAWLLVSLGWIDFSRGAIYLGFLVVGSLSALALATHWREIKGVLLRHWRLLLMGEVLFLVAFLGFVALRAANPDLWHPWRGGEKPMELAYFNAVIRSTTLPPLDPWFSGGYLNYYYWGYFPLAGLVRVTGIVPTTAFNLAVPLFFALTVTAAYSLVYNMAEGVRRSREVSEGEPGSLVNSGRGERRWQKKLWSPVTGGLLAGLFTAVISNLDGAVQIAQGTWYKLVDGRTFPAFDFWRSSRMMPFQENFDPSPLTFWVQDKIPNAPDMSPHITEFPFFTFLFADLHAHMMVIPFTLLVVGLGFCLVLGLRVGDRIWPATAAVLGLALGSLWVINSWDYPSYLLLTLVLLGLAVLLRAGRPSVRLALLAVLGLGVVGLSYLAFLPFHQSYDTFGAGLDPSKWRTPIDRYLAIHGLFIFIVVTFLIYRSRCVLIALAQSMLPGSGAAPNWETRSNVRGLQLSWLKAVLGVGLLLVVLLAVAGFWTAAVLMLLVLLTGTAAWDILSGGGAEQPFAVVPLVLLGMGFALSIGVEFVRLEGDIGRMNSLFKYYLEVWVLMSLAAAYMLWRLGDLWLSGRRWGWKAGIWTAAVVVLIGASLIYTALGSRDRVAEREYFLASGDAQIEQFGAASLTLDGTAFMDRAIHQEDERPLTLKWDLEAIRWLQDNVNGSPVVLEAHNSQYRWSGRISTYTGLPTVLGWPWHQIQQRMPYRSAVESRAVHVGEIYNTTDLVRTESLLREYEVEYIVVGELERAYYSPAGMEKFTQLAGAGRIRPVFQNDGVVIYQIMW
ncbi:MAG: hypothetical protein BZY88_07915 [SAR202 cluster bacterium Io17-Chloro-G9]|nr:MAG: hypothetical protein BZY88_07915 [SAR202 cluster bacterium Io17-Chloro-G9]